MQWHHYGLDKKVKRNRLLKRCLSNGQKISKQNKKPTLMNLHKTATLISHQFQKARSLFLCVPNELTQMCAHSASGQISKRQFKLQ